MTDGTGMTELVGALAKIMAAVGSVEKRGRNDFHRYEYATASDVSHKLQPLMAEHGIIVFQTEKARDLILGDTAMAVTYEFTIAHRSGAVWPDRPVQTGVAAAKTSKGGPDDKAINKCHTAARKYFLLALFQIPTGDFDDADADGEVPSSARGPAPQADRRPPRIDDDGHAGSQAVSYIAEFKTLMQNCDSEHELRDLWNDHKDRRRSNGLSQEQVGEMIACLQVAIAKAKGAADLPQAAE